MTAVGLRHNGNRASMPNATSTYNVETSGGGPRLNQDARASLEQAIQATGPRSEYRDLAREPTGPGPP